MEDLPAHVRHLQLDRHGRPVPWFVAVIDGEPDFRVIGAGRTEDAVRFRRCWTCGLALGAYAAFVIGPMCAVNHVSAEPPSHLDCATFSATHCPFLTTPNMVRRDRHIPEGTSEPAGVMLRRNPGVALIWVTKVWRPWRDHSHGRPGLLFDIGNSPTGMHWYAQGRPATRAEVDASIASGIGQLRDMADAEGPRATAALAAQYQRLEERLDAAVWPAPV